jgi:hypothetical protein
MSFRLAFVIPNKLSAIALFPLGAIVATFVFSSSAVAAKPSRCENQFREVPAAAETVDRYSMRPSLIQKGFVVPSESFHGILKQVAQLVRSLRPSPKITDTVVYPFSGFDFSSPLMLFPNAKTYIMIDRNSVIEAYQLDQIRNSKLEIHGPDRNRSWVIWSQTGNDIFKNILKSLFSVSPNSQIKKVEFIVDEHRQTSLELRFVDGRDGLVKTLHYWVGEVAPLPTEMSVAGRTETGANWWHDSLLAMNPRTILLKGSHSLFRMTKSQYVPAPMREVLTRAILRDGGLVVEGASDMKAVFDADWVKKRSSGLKPDRARWELTDGDPSFQNPVRDAELTGVEFSYSDKVHAAIYAPLR